MTDRKNDGIIENSNRIAEYLDEQEKMIEELIEILDPVLRGEYSDKSFGVPDPKDAVDTRSTMNKRMNAFTDRIIKNNESLKKIKMLIDL